MNHYLRKQLELHPSMQPLDVLKMTFQATFGAEHLLSDLEKARRYLDQEFAETEAKDIPLFEEISPEYSRLNIAAWKYQQRSQEEFFRLFVSSLPEMKKGKEEFLDMVQENVAALQGIWPSDKISQVETLAREMANQLSPIHHSEEYRIQENPHYRIVKTKLILLEK